MLNPKDNKKIKICILEMSSQNKSILEFFFDNSGKSLFEESTIHNASAFIIDYDYPGAKENVEELHETTQIPGILVSIKEVSQPSTVWIAKPITSKALIEARKKLTDIISSPPPVKTQAVIEPVVEKVPEEPVANIDVISAPVAAVEKSAITNESSVESAHKSLAYAGANENTLEAFDVIEPQIEHGQNLEHEEDLAGSMLSNSDASSELIDLDTELQATQNKLETFEPKQETLEIFSDNKDEIDFLLDDLIADDEVAEKSTATDIDHISSENSASRLDHDVTRSSTNEDDFLIDFDTDIKSDTSFEDAKLETNIDTENEFSDLLTDLNFDDNNSISKGKSTHDLDAINSDTLKLEENVDDSVEENGDDSLSTENIFDELTLEAPHVPLDASDQSMKEDAAEISVEAPSIAEFNSFDVTSVNEEESGIIVTNPISTTDLESSKVPTEDLVTSEKRLADDVSETEQDDLLDDIPAVSDEESIRNTEDEQQSAEDELESLLEEIREEAEGQSVSFQHKSEGNRHSPTVAEERWALTCGDVNKSANKGSASYKLSEHMLGALLKVIEHSKQTKKVMRLKFADTIIVIDIETDTVYCDISIYENAYAEVCFNTFDQTAIKIHSLDTSEIRLYRKISEEEPELGHSIEAFIWTTSLLTSRGRLPEGTDVTKVVGLKHWPNLTRLEKIPNVMQIAAVFYKHPGSLKDIPNWLNINKNYIYAFYNAVLSLKMIESDEKLQASSKNGIFKKTKNSGFFSRLLNRINT